MTYSATLLTTMSTLERSSAMYLAVTVFDQLWPRHLPICTSEMSMSALARFLCDNESCPDYQFVRFVCLL
ncbi:MAG: hypothetical protein ACI3YI_08040 [Bacteroidaceae bacterium]